MLASSVGITGYPPVATIGAVPSDLQTGGQLSLSATPAVGEGGSPFTIQLTPVADTNVSSGSASSNYGTSTSMFVQSATTSASSFGNEPALLRFDLHQLPANVTAISAARLKLYCFQGSTAAMSASAYSVADDTWTESGVKWSNQPAFGTALATLNLQPAAINTWQTWGVSSFVLGEFGGDKLVSLGVRADTEDSATDLFYRFDAKEFGSNTPVLECDTQVTDNDTIASVQFFYSFSSDNVNWGAWTAFTSVSQSPWNATFNYPAGNGYYRFYALATDSAGRTQSANYTPTSSAVQYAQSTQAPATPPWALAVAGVMLVGGGSAALARRRRAA